MSIVRLQLDTQALPLWIPEIQANQSDPNLTIYSVTMSYLPEGATDPITVQEYINWSPQNKAESVPPPPSQTGTGFQSTAGQYYYAFNYHWVIQQVYTAMQCRRVPASSLAYGSVGRIV